MIINKKEIIKSNSKLKKESNNNLKKDIKNSKFKNNSLKDNSILVTNEELRILLSKRSKV